MVDEHYFDYDYLQLSYYPRGSAHLSSHWNFENISHFAQQLLYGSTVDNNEIYSSAIFFVFESCGYYTVSVVI